MSIQRFQRVEQSGNQLIAAAQIPADRPADTKLRPNRYDARRAHLAVFNWRRDPTVTIDLSSFLRAGERYRILNVLNYYGQPASEGHYGGQPIERTVPVEERTGRGNSAPLLSSVSQHVRQRRIRDAGLGWRRTTRNGSHHGGTESTEASSLRVRDMSTTFHSLGNLHWPIGKV